MKKSNKKGGWDYRIIRKTNRKLKGCPQSYSYGIYEVYYNDKGIPHGWSSEPMQPLGETCSGLYKDYNAMLDAFTQKVFYLEGGKLVETNFFC